MLKVAMPRLELAETRCEIWAMSTAELYDEDFLLWTKEQARLLREAAERGVNLPLDWENLAEEVESLGRSDRRELRSRISTIIEHLLKLEHSSAREPREGWRNTVDRSRREAKLILKESPSLQHDVPELLDEASANFAEFALRDLIGRGELDESRQEEILGRPYTEDQVLGGWFPDGSA
ncbi:MAG TPA: DUF29 domain-containing protein [Beijerinckiaceae bacterium]|jgi:hypothetical protein|nr:DUF29 domain-containing protein [Beijerinckiaceae bacterium]